jgi:hypothetical protein
VPAKPFGTDAATPPKDVLACPCPLLADDAGDPELSGLEHALLFKKLPRPAHKGGGMFQMAGLLEEELLQLRGLGVIEGAEPQITGDGLLMLGDRRLPFAVEFNQPRIKPQLRRAEVNDFLEELEGLLLREAIEEPDEGDLVGKAKAVMRAPALAELHEIFFSQAGGALELVAGKHYRCDTANAEVRKDSSLAYKITRICLV